VSSNYKFPTKNRQAKREQTTTVIDQQLNTQTNSQRTQEGGVPLVACPIIIHVAQHKPVSNTLPKRCKCAILLRSTQERIHNCHHLSKDGPGITHSDIKHITSPCPKEKKAPLETHIGSTSRGIQARCSKQAHTNTVATHTLLHHSGIALPVCSMCTVKTWPKLSKICIPQSQPKAKPTSRPRPLATTTSTTASKTYTVTNFHVCTCNTSRDSFTIYSSHCCRLP
jgi:hypothetical protein